LELQPSDRSRAALHGRAEESIVGDAPLAVTLVAWAPQAGEAKLHLAVQDEAGQPAPGLSSLDSSLTLVAGMNRWRQYVDLSSVRPGPLQLRVALDLAHGTALLWQTALLRYEDVWEEKVAKQLAAVDPLEQPTIQYRLAAIAAARKRHHPFDDPSPIGTTMREVDRLLERASSTGTVLPDHGTFIVACPGPASRPVPCSLHLPSGHGAGDRVRLLVLIPDVSSDATRVATRVGEAITAQGDLLVLVPHHQLAPGHQGDLALIAAKRAVAWASERFQPISIQLAGFDTGGGVALRLSLQQPDSYAGVLLAASDGFNPWPRRKRFEIAALLTERANPVSYTMYIFPEADLPTTPATVLKELMPTAGFRLRVEQPLQDHYQPDQVATLVTRWLAGEDDTAPE
jgi:hypothetical protein